MRGRKLIPALLVVGLAVIAHISLAAPTLEPPRIPLIEAVKQKDLEAARRLLDAGADPNAREVMLTKPSLSPRVEGGERVLGDTALMIAIDRGDLPLVRLLLEKGADVNKTGEADYTPLIEATREHQLDIAKLLLEHGARPNHRNVIGDTALVFAASEGQSALAALLLDHGADINGGVSWTPLMQAAYHGHAEMVRLLIRRGANVNLTRNRFMTPLECALMQTHDDVADLIRAAGGHGRTREVMLQEGARLSRAREAKERADNRRLGPKEILTSEDRQVIETVLSDLLADEGEALFRSKPAERIILLWDTTRRGSGMISDGQINGELDHAQACDISLEMRESLQRRNREPISLAELQPRNDKILIQSENAIRAAFGYPLMRYSLSKAYVQVYLPGYSKQRDRAVVRFGFGPSAHGAAGTYFLLKEKGGWRVKWRDFVFYA